MAMLFDPSHVDLLTADPKDVICYLSSSDGSSSDEFSQGVRLSAVFVILVVSTIATVFPVMATRIPWLRVPLYAYLLVRYFGAGVIIATAFIHLLDPAYSEIGPQTCVGMTGAWANFSWPPALALTSAMCVFLLDFVVERHVGSRLGGGGGHRGGSDVEETVTTTTADANVLHHHHHHDDGPQRRHHQEQQQQVVVHHGSKQDDGHIDDGEHQEPSHGNNDDEPSADGTSSEPNNRNDATVSVSVDKNERTFGEQIGAFMVLEIGVIVHSIIIGLNLGVAGSEFGTLYAVLLFHQSFEGMGIGARLSVIPFPPRLSSWLPWLLCIAYGLTTPIAIAVGLSLRSTYAPESFTANVVSGVLDSVSAGILLYTGFVELLARDFLLHPERTLDQYRVSFAIFCLYLGIAIMALLGKWA